ncbi:MAG: hypothetical protein AAGJ28_22505 [Pseudomonadota bacterium]
MPEQPDTPDRGLIYEVLSALSLDSLWSAGNTESLLAHLERPLMENDR